MTHSEPTTMKALRLHSYGEPTDVLKLEEAAIPSPRAGQVRVRVYACALNPADWAMCRGFFPVPPPRGIGFDVSGTVDAVGDGVANVRVGDLVFGVPDFMGQPTAGAAEYAILKVFVPVQGGLDLTEVAALPMSVETAVRSIDLLGLTAGQTILVNGGGTMTGFAAVQIALLRGAHVIASAGETFAGRLRELGARVTSYGDGMVERVREIAGGAPDFALHTAQVTGVLPDLIKIVDGDPRRVMSFADFDKDGLGVRTTGREKGVVQRYDALGHYARLAAEGRFTIPVARIFGLGDWREAAELSMSRRAHGKLVLLPGRAVAAEA
jgi:NADPH:quinone reductase-like Zn-dependent oxidoreductase